ncbi:DUF2268 domain-containing protein [Sporosarcina sp. BI001-red]|uniref:DUF2268 domain-containing protein n=1 Tax=Sporosarcina sp. BI001-red TaxID=2282866 RepID=UPI001314AEC6|nr:DUF2268 domain-containing protein [Sporosarcina sp. BI001-red]
MPVIKTNEWLLEHYQDPLKLCKKMKPFFPRVSVNEIYDYFRLHGMYQEAVKSGATLVQTMKQNNIWGIVEREHQALQKKWKGPDVPIIILPSNTADPKLLSDTNGKAGLAFADKLFLFVPETILAHELKALFIHEYNHLCRMWLTKKEENSFTLLDSIILEGLAEHAVRERLGEAFTATWTNYYSHEKLARIWEKSILPKRMLKKSHHLHNQYLYGWNGHPKMAGYCVGYYLVETYMNTHKVCILDILGENAEVIAGLTQLKK